jgi:drug/metabolite transporter (DMT)-like permease
MWRMSRPGSVFRNPQDPSHGGGHAPTWGVWTAMWAVYIVWGSTYLAIRVAVETIPPFLSASIRFLVAGALLYPVAIRMGDRAEDRPTRRHWRSAAIIGGALLVGGNGMVVWAEQTVPSGIAALIVATVPLWMVLIAAVVLRERASWREVLGIVVGFVGILLLVGPAGSDIDLDLVGAGAVVVASLSWASGSLYARRAPLPRRPLVGVAMEMLAGGAILLLVAAATGELVEVRLADFSLASTLAVAYLVVFGSLVGFAAYAWLLRVARTSLVATYAYVNPVIAVFLGWAILREDVTSRTLLAGLVIVGAVALIVSAKAQPGVRDEAAAADEVDGEPGPGAGPTEHGPPEGPDAPADGQRGISSSNSGKYRGITETSKRARIASLGSRARRNSKHARTKSSGES